MEEQDEFERLFKIRSDAADQLKRRIISIKGKIENAQSQGNERHVDIFTTQLADNEKRLLIQESFMEFMRMPKNGEDNEYRAKVMREFPDKVRKTIPDRTPIVFHGTNNIAVVRKIIRTGGLLTPEQKGESMTSFASGIDVTYKDNIRVSCEFAEYGSNGKFMPYGAIFAFTPEENEVDKCITTGESSEVYGGINGVSFKNEPNRLRGIITTPENIETIRQWCQEYGLDPQKVFSHGDFLETYRSKTHNTVDTQETQILI